MSETPGDMLPEAAILPGGPPPRAGILLVDDRERNLVTLEMVLKDLGQEVVKAASGQEALRHLLAQDFAVVLLDVRMPDMDGFETAELIRKRQRSRHTPIIFVTALDANPEDIARGYAVGAVDFLFRPFMPEVLKAKVKVFLDLFESREVLRASELRFSTLVGNIPGALYRRSVASPWDLHFMSDAIEGITGFPASDFLERTRTLGDLLHPDDQGPFERALRATFQERRPYALEYRIIHRNRSVRWISDRGQGIPNRSGQIEYLDGILFDITETRLAEEEVRERTRQLADSNSRLQEQIVERQRAEEERSRMSAQLLQGQKLQAIGQLAAGIAHEINNPVGYILSNTVTGLEYLRNLERLLEAMDQAIGVRPTRRARPSQEPLDRLRKEIDAPFLLRDFGEALKDVKEGAERIRDIVKNLKEFTHLDPGDWKPARLEDLLESAIRLCWNEIKYKAEVRRDFAPLPPLVCHPQQIEQVFVNLLVNAAQALDGKGTIFLSLREESGDAIVGIRDTGSGIPPEVLPKLFEPFFTTKPVGQGTGLGLHVVHKIVQGHQGRIEVRSTPGEGTEFTIRFPLQKSPLPAQADSSPSPETASGREDFVLLVDDDPPTLHTLRRLLEGEPYTLLATAQPEEALEWVGRRKVGVVISDQRMPGLTGTRLLASISQRSPGTACVLLTAYPDDDEVIQSERAGVTTILSKPWDGEALKKTIRAHLASGGGIPGVEKYSSDG
ncbi:MAG TPA: response regulator [Planctomycetota bacterium]|nr:response regulator [Planctomycetota bacterium]